MRDPPVVQDKGKPQRPSQSLKRRKDDEHESRGGKSAKRGGDVNRGNGRGKARKARRDVE